MRPVPSSWTSPGGSVGALVLVGLGVCAQVTVAQPDQPHAPPVRMPAALEDVAPARRLQALLSLLPRLEHDAALRAQPDLHRAVASMLAQECTAMRDAARQGRVAAGDGATADLLMVVGLRLLPHASGEPRATLLSALVAGYYAPGSRFAADLAVHGTAIVDDVIRLAAEVSPAHRANAYGLMGRVLNNHGAGALEDTLEVEQALDLVNALRAGLDDEEAAVRALVVDALVAAGDAASLRRLTEVARWDVSPMVRQRAREAVTTLGQ